MSVLKLFRLGLCWRRISVLKVVKGVWTPENIVGIRWLQTVCRLCLRTVGKLCGSRHQKIMLCCWNQRWLYIISVKWLATKQKTRSQRSYVWRYPFGGFEGMRWNWLQKYIVRMTPANFEVLLQMIFFFLKNIKLWRILACRHSEHEIRRWRI